jgi:hypothetical protein
LEILNRFRKGSTDKSAELTAFEMLGLELDGDKRYVKRWSEGTLRGLSREGKNSRSGQN